MSRRSILQDGSQAAWKRILLPESSEARLGSEGPLLPGDGSCVVSSTTHNLAGASHAGERAGTTRAIGQFEKFEGKKNRKTAQKCLLMYAGAVVLSYIKSENAS